MPTPLRVTPGELSADEMLNELQDGRRIIVETDLLGTPHEITLRYDGTIFYCDTPTTLHRHETVEEMRTCLEEQRYCEIDQ